MNSMDLCCKEQKRECFYHMFYRCYICLYLKNLNIFSLSHHTVHRCALLKIWKATGSSLKNRKRETKNFNRLDSLYWFLYTVKFGKSRCQNKCTLLKSCKFNCKYFRVLILKKNKKVVFCFHHSSKIICMLPQNRLEKWLSALMVYLKVNIPSRKC